MKLFYVFPIVLAVLFSSCNSSSDDSKSDSKTEETSKKGKWTKDDIEKARKSLESGGITETEVQDCIIDKLEQEFDSFSDADSRDGGEEKENKLVSLMTDCMMGTEFGDGWSDEDIERAEAEIEKVRESLEPMLGDNTDTYIDCYLEKIMMNYDNFDDANADFKGCEALAQECMQDLL